MLFVYAGITALFAAGAYVTHAQRGWTWVSVGLALAALVLGPGSIVESIILRIELADDALVVTDLRGRRRYARSAIVRIEEAKGTPPALLLTDGRWIKLPAVGSDLGNSVRAWLRAR